MDNKEFATKTDAIGADGEVIDASALAKKAVEYTEKMAKDGVTVSADQAVAAVKEQLGQK